MKNFQAISVVKQQLFDGTDEGYYSFTQNLNLGDKEIVVQQMELRKNYFENLEAETAVEDFEQLIAEGNFKKPKTALGEYTGTDKLPLYYYKEVNCLAVFAAGEFQPSRHKIYFEGMWQFS